MTLRQPAPSLIRLAWWALAALLAVAGARGDETITVSWLPRPGYVGNELVFTKLLAQYRADHPAVSVRLFRLMALPDQFAEASSALGVAASAGPDVLALPLDRFGDYVREGLIQPVDDLYGTFTDTDREWPALRDALRLEGKVWTACATVHVPVLAISRDACKAAGVTPAQLPTDWNGLAALAAKLTKKDVAGLGLARGEMFMGLWTALARQAGEDPGGAEGPDGHRAYALNAPGCVAAAEKLRVLGESVRAAGGRIVFADDAGALDASLSKGEVAMGLLDSALMFAPVDPEESGDVPPFRGKNPYLIPLPGAFSATPVVWATKVDAWVMPSSVTDRARKRILWEYMTTVSSLNPAHDEEAFKSLSTVDAIPDLGAVVRHPERATAGNMPPDWLATFRKLLPLALPQPPYAEHRAMAARLCPALEKLVLEGGAAAPVMAEAQRRYDAEVRNAGRRGSGLWHAAAYGVLALMMAMLVGSVAYLVRLLLAELRSIRGRPSAGLSRKAIGVLLALFAPGLLLSLAFAAYPLANGFGMSLFAHVLKHGGTFVGAGNFVDVILDPVAGRAVAVTLGYLAWSFVLAFVGPLVLAIVLSGFRRLQAVMRLLFFVPAAANAVVIALLWKQMYAPAGAVNLVGHLLGFAPVDWLARPGTAVFAVCAAQAWAGVGINGLVYLAGLATIPESLFEEAEMVGSGLTERWTTILWPHLKPLIGISFVGWLLAAARTSEHVLLMTAGGPDRATHLVGLDIFKRAYVDISFGMAMAQVWLLISLVLVLAIYQMRAIREGQLRVAM